MYNDSLSIFDQFLGQIYWFCDLQNVGCLIMLQCFGLKRVDISFLQVMPVPVAAQGVLCLVQVWQNEFYLQS
jgi:hypothetical protein